MEAEKCMSLTAAVVSALAGQYYRRRAETAVSDAYDRQDFDALREIVDEVAAYEAEYESAVEEHGVLGHASRVTKPLEYLRIRGYAAALEELENLDDIDDWDPVC